jgi:hypothetical protein
MEKKTLKTKRVLEDSSSDSDNDHKKRPQININNAVIPEHMKRFMESDDEDEVVDLAQMKGGVQKAMMSKFEDKILKSMMMDFLLL